MFFLFFFLEKKEPKIQDESKWSVFLIDLSLRRFVGGNTQMFNAPYFVALLYVLCDHPKSAVPALAFIKVVRFPQPGPAKALDWSYNLGATNGKILKRYEFLFGRGLRKMALRKLRSMAGDCGAGAKAKLSEPSTTFLVYSKR